jgi:hypothetical protein
MENGSKINRMIVHILWHGHTYGVTFLKDDTYEFCSRKLLWCYDERDNKKIVIHNYNLLIIIF